MSERKMVKRSDLKAFYGVGENATYTRMRGFSELSESKNPKTYTRQYVDESFEATDVVGYSPSLSFSFDKYSGDAVLEDIANLIDDEILGTQAQREIIQVDFSKPSGNGFEARKRKVSVIGNTLGNSLDALTYSGELRPVGAVVTGIATIATPSDGNSENVETITFEEDNTATE